MDTKLPANRSLKSPLALSTGSAQPSLKTDSETQSTSTSDSDVERSATDLASRPGGRSSSYRPSHLASTSRVLAHDGLFGQDQKGGASFVGLLKDMANSLAELTENQETISQITHSPQATIKALQHIPHWCSGIEKAMQDLVHAISPEDEQAIEKRVSDMVRLEQKTPAQAAVLVALESVAGLQDQSEPQVLEAAVCTATRNIATALRHASQMSQDGSLEVTLAVLDTLSRTHSGQLILAFLDGMIAQGSDRTQSKSTDDELSFLVEPTYLEFHLPDLMEWDHDALMNQAPLLNGLGSTPEICHSDQIPFLTDADLIETNDLMSDLWQDTVAHVDSMVREIPLHAPREKILLSIAQSVRVAQTEANWALTHLNPSSAGFSQALKQITIDAARFVENEAEVALKPQSRLADVAQAQRRCNAGKQAVLAVTAVCKQESQLAIQNDVINAIHTGTQSPAQAVADVVATAVKEVLAYRDLNEVTVARAAVAAVTLTVATEAALKLKPADAKQITEAVQFTLLQSVQGQAVTELMMGIRAAGSSSNLSGVGFDRARRPAI